MVKTHNRTRRSGTGSNKLLEDPRIRSGLRRSQRIAGGSMPLETRRSRASPWCRGEKISRLVSWITLATGGDNWHNFSPPPAARKTPNNRINAPIRSCQRSPSRPMNHYLLDDKMSVPAILVCLCTSAQSFDLLAVRETAFAPDHQHAVHYLALDSQFHVE